MVGQQTESGNGSRKLKGLFRVRVRVGVGGRFPFQWYAFYDASSAKNGCVRTSQLIQEKSRGRGEGDRIRMRFGKLKTEKSYSPGHPDKIQTRRGKERGGESGMGE